VINQNRYSILDRGAQKNGILKSASDAKKGMIIYSPLAQGLLSGRYLNGIPGDSRVKTDGRFLNEKSLSPEILEKIRKLNEIALERGQTLAQMALSWVYAKEGITSVLIGASKPEQIIENLKMTENTSFTKEELDKIDAAVL
jgi:L-glyceraldehyde 3-phosphate reductase